MKVINSCDIFKKSNNLSDVKFKTDSKIQVDKTFKNIIDLNIQTYCFFLISFVTLRLNIIN